MNSITRHNVIFLFFYQAIAGAQMPILFITGGLAGQMLSPIACMATLPISCIVFGSMLSAPRLSKIMQSRGRKIGFWCGNVIGALGASIATLALYLGSFELLIVGSILSGAAMSAGVLSRFAATDYADDNSKARAISIVMAAGLVAAIFGPWLVKEFNALFVIRYLGTYMVIIALNIMGIVICAFLRDGPRDGDKNLRNTGRSVNELLRTPVIYVAIITGMVTYALMNLVMTATPLAVVGCGFSTNNAADIVMFHVLAMYGPSFFTGYLISYFGVQRIIGIGLVILTISGLFALSGVELWNFYAALILLGLGWNFGFIGATTLLASSHTSVEKARIQGLNDAIVFGFVTIASLASGGLMNCVGGDVVTGWKAVNYAMIPFLMLAGGALISLRFTLKAKATPKSRDTL